jgi:SAM-dependent methyltransferase/uncharacterized protein YbaR (Trm112 family)
MDHHTNRAKDWLDRRYGRKADGAYLAHQPIHGLRTTTSEPNIVQRFARTYRLLAWISTLGADSVLDVGGGEGYLAALVRDLFAPSVAHSSDLSTQACMRGGEIFGVQGLAADSARLPLADGSYDVVICSEVIEHLSRPALAIAELSRVARKYVVISTAEFCPLGEAERALRLTELDRSYPHAEMNWFTANDFVGLLGSRVVLSSQYRTPRVSLENRDWDDARVAKVLDLLTHSTPLSVDHTGVIVICAKPGVPLPSVSAISDEVRLRILQRLIGGVAPDAPTAGARAIEPALLERLRCPGCASVAPLAVADAALSCGSCGAHYAIAQGIPEMLMPGGDHRPPDVVEDACVRQLAGDDPVRAGEVRRVIATLHRPAAAPYSRTSQAVAHQLLRLMWLFGRDEPLVSKLARVGRRLSGREHADDLQHAALVRAIDTTASERD